MRIAMHLIQVVVVNAYVVYKEIGGTGKYLDFLIDVCRCLCAAEDSHDSDESSCDDDEAPPVSVNRSLSAKDIPKPIRYDKINH